VLPGVPVADRVFSPTLRTGNANRHGQSPEALFAGRDEVSPVAANRFPPLAKKRVMTERRRRGRHESGIGQPPTGPWFAELSLGYDG